MNWINSDKTGSDKATTDRVRPTTGDERSAVVDDAQVIERTLPARSLQGVQAVRERVRGGVERAAGATRGYVSQSPLSATLMAAAGGAALTALFLLVGGRMQPQPSPVYAGLRRIRAAIR